MATTFRTVLQTFVILLLVFVSADGSCGWDECIVPDVFGGGTPIVFPASSCYSTGTNVTLGCSGILFGSSEALCHPTGSWYYYGPTPTCEEHLCPPPSPPDHGFGEYSQQGDYELYDRVSFACDDGYILFGSTTVMCAGTGEWEPTIPTCSENCTIPDIDYGNTDFAPGTSLHDGCDIEVSCEKDFTLTGPESITCHDGTWKPFVGECLQNCPSPIIDHSDYVKGQNTTSNGEHVVVRCDAGYTSGSGSNDSTPLTCNDGLWDSSVVCYANCERPHFQESLQITPEVRINDSYYDNDVIAVGCAPKYRHSHGPQTSSMVCDNGYWMAAILPVCTFENSAPWTALYQ